MMMEIHWTRIRTKLKYFSVTMYSLCNCIGAEAAARTF